MQIKTFTVPVVGGEQIEAELNAFLRSRKILKTEKGLMREGDSAAWCFCISYLGDNESMSKARKDRPNYKKILDEKTFHRFEQFRVIRKELSSKEGIPAYAVFTDVELVKIAKLGGEITLAQIRKLEGVGESKMKKYAHYFILKNEKDREFNT